MLTGKDEVGGRRAQGCPEVAARHASELVSLAADARAQRDVAFSALALLYYRVLLLWKERQRVGLSGGLESIINEVVLFYLCR